MITIIKGCNVYAPKSLGIKDVVLAGGKIEGIYDYIDFCNEKIDYEIIDCRGKILFPGFIDNHVHVIGGGGEGVGLEGRDGTYSYSAGYHLLRARPLSPKGACRTYRKTLCDRADSLDKDSLFLSR